MQLLKDRIGRSGPAEWAVVRVVVRDELVDALDELLDAGERTATDRLVGDSRRDPPRLGLIDLERRLTATRCETQQSEAAKHQSIRLRFRDRSHRTCNVAPEEGLETARGGNSSQTTTSYPPTLANIGITKDQSSRWQSLASMTYEQFENAVATAKDTAGQVTTAFMMREAKAAKPQARPLTGA